MAETQRVQYWLDRHKTLAKRRDANFPIWQELADHLNPVRGGFTSEITAGQEITVNIYDSTPMQARRGLATAIDGLMKPLTTRWFWMKAQNESWNEIEGAKYWFDIVTDRMWAAIYNPNARFMQQSAAVDNDLATFGLGYLWMGENKNKNGLTFKSLHIKSVAIDEDSDGIINTACIETPLYSATEAEARWKEKIGPKVREALADPKKKDEKLFKFLQCIYPNETRDTRQYDNTNMNYTSIYLSKEDETILEESGFQEFPLACPRWEVIAGEIYPRSPGMLALPDSRTLQDMGLTLLVGGQKAVDPPTWSVDDGTMSAVRTFPGGHTIVSAEAIKDTGGRPLGVLEMGKQIPIGREMQFDYRKMVEAAFFKNVFNLPVQGPEMTATEIMARKEEFLRTIGPTLGQLEADYIGAIVGRVFGIMARAGAFPPAPKELQGGGARFEFMSPVQQAKRQIESAGMARAFEFLTPIAVAKPEVWDNFDEDAIARDMPETFMLRQKWLRTIDGRDAIRAQRNQAAAMATGLAGAQMGAGVGKTLADTNKSIVDANQSAK